MIREQNAVSPATLALLVLALIPAILCGGCAAGWSSQTGTSLTVTISTGQTIPSHLVLLPEVLTIRHGENWNFNAVLAEVGYPVIDQPAVPVSWSIAEGPAGGSITSSGLYTAPSTAGTYHVVATDTANPAITATTVVTVGQGLTMSGDTTASIVVGSAMLLNNGQVLLVGESEVYWDNLQATLALYRADLYDPATDVFQFATTLPSDGATATLLPSGDVLLLGGATSITYPGSDLNPIGAIITANAEIYKAATGTIQAAGSMSIARSGHTATLLPNGKILVTGGAIQDPLPTNAGYSTLTATAELYDPTSGTSTAIGNMNVPLAGHQAILLQNGKVLILGPASAQIYDPSANAFSPVDGSSLLNSGSIATLLLDGRVLITCGAVPDPPFYGDLAADTVYIYDPTSGQITPAGSKMNVPRSSHTATLMPNGTVLIAGGETLPPPGDTDPMDSGANNTTEIFDPSTNTFTLSHAMQTPREGHTATLLSDGTVLIVGGSFGIPSISTEIFR